MSDGACYATRGFWRKPPTWPRGCRRVPITLEDRGRFLLDYINLLTTERAPAFPAPARSHDRWVINKVRALGSWYTKGLEGGSHLRIGINSAESLPALRDLIGSFFFAPALTR